MGGNKKKNQKQKNTEQSQPQQQQIVQQQQQQQQQHQHQHAHTHTHTHDQNCQHDAPLGAGAADLLSGLGGTGDLFSKLTQMMSQLGNLGGQSVKPDDPLPDFTKFDSTKQTLEVAIDDFHQTIEEISKGDFSKVTKPQTQKQQNTKLTKQQQQQKDKNNQIIKQNIDYLNSLQKDLKKLMQDASLANIVPILSQSVESLSQDIQYYQKQQEV